MGKGGQGNENEISRVKEYSMEDVKTHTQRDDKWLVVEGDVYNITEWSKRHPGGSRVISHYAGQDATDAFRAFHNDLSFVKKHLKPLHLGSLRDADCKETEIQSDFRDLRVTAEKMKLFKPSFLFFTLHLAHILLLEYLSWAVMAYFGTGWIPYCLSLIFYGTVMAQAGWLQHDFGHLSVFHKSKWDHLLHFLTIGFVKGASPQWWNHMHYQHHAKPNIMNKDPDVRVEQLFVVGKTMPIMVAKDKTKSMPYNWQQHYFFLIGPPLLFPVYFQYMLLRHIFTRKAWWDLLIVGLFFVKFIYLYVGLLGFGSAVVYYFALRCVESHWFTWVAQSNHIPMDIEEDQAEPWLALQMHATCNVEQSFFNDWFTGHLNFQIEHHLFPTMPRHNLYKIAPLVKTLCEKHGIDYQLKSLWTAFADIPRSLKHSGELWYSTYNAFHSS